MKREIKFRVWDVDNKIFIDSWWIQFGHNTIRLVTDVGCHFDIINCHENDKNKYVIQQFTGLKDMDGKEIYDGDILENVQYGNVFRIEWAKERDYCGFVTINLKDGFRNLCLVKNFANCKIVGNVFDEVK